MSDGEVIRSRGSKGAEQSCAALLKDDMVPFCAVAWHRKRIENGGMG